MRCPFCKSALIVGEERRFQMLHEHVSDPNYIPGARLTNVCTCEKSKQYFWDDDGGVYVKNNGDIGLYFDHKKELGSLSALDSFEREFEEKKQ